MNAPQISQGSLALTQQELKALSTLVNEGDRAGFYMAYNAMTRQ